MVRATTLLWQALLAASLLLFLNRPQASRSVPVADPAVLLRKQRMVTPGRQVVANGASDPLPGVATTPPKPVVTAAAAPVATAASTASTDDPLMGEGQCEHARLSVQTAIEKQREPTEGALWQNTQTSYGQAKRESKPNANPTLNANPNPNPQRRRQPPPT